MEFRKDVQGLRALAIVLVVCFHLGMPFLDSGFVGVDIFFVISGFIISEVSRAEIAANDFHAWGFLLRRMRRIHPPLIAAVFACILFATYFYLPVDYTTFVRNARSALIAWSNVAFSTDAGYFAQDSHFNLILHTWSLSVELQFYICFATFCWLTKLARLTPRQTYMCLFALGVASLALMLHSSAAASQKPFYLLTYRYWEFAAGIAVSAYRPRGAREKPDNVLALAGVCFFVATLCVIKSSTPFPNWRALLPVAGTALLLISRKSYVNRILSAAPLQYLGAISYSLYLWHWPVLAAFLTVVGRPITWGQKALAAVVFIIASLLSYRYLERPSKTAGQRRAVDAVCFASIVAALAYSSVVSADGGMPGRLPKAIEAVIAAESDRNPREKECLRGLDGEKRSPGEYCFIGVQSDAAPSIMLWGDSFADRLQPDVDRISQSLDIRGIIATHSGCAAMTPEARAKYHPGNAQTCLDYNDKVYRHLLDTPSIKTVILEGIWAGYNRDMLKAEFAQIAELLAQRGGHLVVVLTVPEARLDVPRVLVGRVRHSGRGIENWVMPRSSQVDVDALGQDLANFLKGVPNAIVVNPFDALCDAQNCQIVDNAEILYMDGFHLSMHGAARLQPGLAKAITKAVKG